MAAPTVRHHVLTYAALLLSLSIGDAAAQAAPDTAAQRAELGRLEAARRAALALPDARADSALATVLAGIDSAETRYGAWFGWPPMRFVTAVPLTELRVRVARATGDCASVRRAEQASRVAQLNAGWCERFCSPQVLDAFRRLVIAAVAVDSLNVQRCR